MIDVSPREVVVAARSTKSAFGDFVDSQRIGLSPHFTRVGGEACAEGGKP